MRPAAIEPEATQLIAGAFTAAALLSADLAEAEASVAHAAGADGEQFLLAVIGAAIETGPNHPESAEVSAVLPPELRAVLRLPKLLRHCFVLRVLLALPEETCARLLHVQPGHIRHFVSLAAVQLAQPHR